MFRVTDPTPLKAAVYVPERELARLKPGQTASISVDALAGRSFPAIVKLVSPTVDAATATFKVTLEVNDPKGDLKPGMFSRVGIVFERRAEALTIPRIALLDTDGSSNVFVVNERQGRAARHQDRPPQRRQDRSDRRAHRHRAGGDRRPERPQGRQSGTRRHRSNRPPRARPVVSHGPRGLRDSPARHHRHGDGGDHPARDSSPCRGSRSTCCPTSSYPTLTIRTELPGAAPTEIENLISRPIEEAAGVVRNVRSVRSVSRSGQSDVIIEFTWGTDMDFAGIEVRERLDLLWLPVEATRPLLLRFDPSSEPVMRRGPRRRNRRRRAVNEDRLKFLRRFADDRIKPEIESVEGSAAVKVSGGFEDEVQIYCRSATPRAAATVHRTGGQAASARKTSISPAAGWNRARSASWYARVNEFDTLDDMANAVIANVDGQPSSISRTSRASSAATRIAPRSRASTATECIELAIYKEGDAQHRAARARHHATSSRRSEKTLPGGTKLVPVYDQSKFIASAVSDVKDAAILGGLLSILVLYFFLRDAWATIVTGIVIPVTVVGIFVMMYALRSHAERDVAGRHRAVGGHADRQLRGHPRGHRAAQGSRPDLPSTRRARARRRWPPR